MPRVSKAQAAAHHQTIETAVSVLFRQRGLLGGSVADPLSAEIVAAARARLTGDDATRRSTPDARKRRTSRGRR